jgi:catechol 2,3-dioxygenase-like lactoylglutathione lyase family enzyme
MTITKLDHVNVRTANVDAMSAWYRDVLGLPTGPRPAFAFPGAWHYCGDHPVVHLVGVDTQPGADTGDLRLEHFALSATGLPDFVARLKQTGEEFRARPLDDFGIIQINVYDPDGNHIHIDFPISEGDGVDL